MTNIKEQIKKALQENTNLTYLGARTIDQEYSVGDIMEDSYQWNFDLDCSTYETDEPETLGGACATDCADGTWAQFSTNLDDEELDEIVDFVFERLVYNADNYPYDYTYLIGAKYSNDDLANDEYETILVDAQVLLVLDRDELRQYA